MKIIEATDRTPKIALDYKENTVSFTGILIPENPVAYFDELNKELDTFYDENKIINFIFDLEYFNTGSTKYIYKLLLKYASLNLNKVIWIYEEDDIDILETGKDFEELSKIKFTFKTK